MEDKHPMLVSAMQACGAVFVKTQTSLAFVQRTLEHLGDNLIAEFVSIWNMTERFGLKLNLFCSLNLVAH